MCDILQCVAALKRNERNLCVCGKMLRLVNDCRFMSTVTWVASLVPFQASVLLPLTPAYPPLFAIRCEI